jgi:hypothetical protein
MYKIMTIMRPQVCKYRIDWSKAGVHRYSKILGTRRVIWSKFHNENSQILGASIQNSVVQVTWRLGFVHPTSKVCNLNLYMPSCSSHDDSQASFFHFWKLQSHVCVCVWQTKLLTSVALIMPSYVTEKNIVSRAYIPLLKKRGEGKQVSVTNTFIVCPHFNY